MIIEPNSNIRIIKAELELDNLNQLTFDSKAAQETYFKSLPYVEIDDASYQRKDGYIRFPEPFDEAIKYTYCMYQNESYSNKWFYAFITNIEYLNDECCAMYLETDVFQTWQFDITYKPSFIEREHVIDDSIGKHTLPEGLETGEYVCSSKTSLFSGGNSVYIVITCTEVPSEINVNNYIAQYGGVYSGTVAMVFENTDDGLLSASKFLRIMDELDKGDAITGIYLAPQSLCNNPTFSLITISGRTIKCGTIPYSTSYSTLNTVTGITKPSSLNGYIPKNNKLWTYPYNYFYVSNNVGIDAEFRYEDFIGNSPSFKTIGSLTPGCSIKCIPLNYKLLIDNSSMNSYNYGISGAKYPICSWNTDEYINWLTANGVNIGLSTAGSIGGIVGGIALLATGAGTLAGAGAIAGGFMGIGRSIAQVYEHSLMPPQAKGNENSGDITFSSNNMDIPLYKMTIRAEYAEIIDNYFSMYGYKTNLVKLPNLNTRPNWNFIKTINCNIIGDIPQKDIQKIKDMFNNGVTLWHNPSTFLDYSQTNS